MSRPSFSTFVKSIAAFIDLSFVFQLLFVPAAFVVTMKTVQAEDTTATESAAVETVTPEAPAFETVQEEIVLPETQSEVLETELETEIPVITEEESATDSSNSTVGEKNDAAEEAKTSETVKTSESESVSDEIEPESILSSFMMAPMAIPAPRTLVVSAPTLLTGTDCTNAGAMNDSDCFTSLQDAVNNANAGDTIEIKSDLTVGSQIKIENKTDLTINGNSKKVHGGFHQSNGNSVILISKSKITINNLTVDAQGGTKIHGINIWKSQDVELKNVTILNAKESILSPKYGLVVGEDSHVIVENITTRDNDRGINVDKGSPKLTITGQSDHNELFAIYTDKREPSYVDDQNQQYSRSNVFLGGYRYSLKSLPATPVISAPTANQEFDVEDVTVSWNNISGAHDYELELNSSTEPLTQIVSGTSHNFTDLENGTYTVRVRARTATGIAGNWSNSVSFEVDVVIPEIRSVGYATMSKLKGASYTGIVVDSRFFGFSDATAFSATIHRADGSTATRIGKQDVLDIINTSKSLQTSLTTPFAFVGSTDNSYYTATSNNIWTDETKPVAITITITSAKHGDVIFTTPVTQSLTEKNGLYSDLYPAPTPTGLKITDTNGNDVSNKSVRTQEGTSSWNAAPNAVAYNYEFRKPSGLPTFEIQITGTSVTGLLHDENSPEGEYAFRVQSVSADGTVSAWSEEVSVFYDKSAPNIANVTFSPQINGNIGATTTVEFDVIDASEIDISKSRVLFADGPNTSNQLKESAKQSFIHIAGNRYKAVFDTKLFVRENYVGKYNLTFNLYDVLGNQKSSKPVKILVDNSGPTSQLTSPANNSIIGGTQTLQFNLTDDTGIESVRIRLSEVGNPGNEKWYHATTFNNTSGSLTFNTSDLVDGVYTVAIRPVDSFGRPRLGVNKGIIIIDNTAPETSGNMPVVLVNGDTATLHGRVFDNNFEHFYCWVTGVTGGEVGVRQEDCLTTWSQSLKRAGNGFTEFDTGTVQNQTDASDTTLLGSVNIDGLADGQYYFNLVAKDKARNASEPVKVLFTIDNTAPVAEITTPATEVTYSDETTTATITGQVSDNVKIKQYRFEIQNADGVYVAGPGLVESGYSITTHSWGWDTSIVPNGTYTIFLWAIDMAGNETSVTRTVLVENSEAPVVEEPEEEVLGTTTPQIAQSSNGVGGGTAEPEVCAAATPSTIGLLGINTLPNGLALTWNKAEGQFTHYAMEIVQINAAGQEVARHGVPAFGDTNSTSFTIQNLPGGHSYRVELFAVNDCMPGPRAVATSGNVTEPGAEFGTGGIILTPDSGEEVVLGASTDEELIENASQEENNGEIAGGTMNALLSGVLGASTEDCTTTSWWWVILPGFLALIAFASLIFSGTGRMIAFGLIAAGSGFGLFQTLCTPWVWMGVIGLGALLVEVLLRRSEPGVSYVAPAKKKARS